MLGDMSQKSTAFLWPSHECSGAWDKAIYSVEDPSAEVSHFCLCRLRARAANMSNCFYLLPGVWHSWKKPNLNKIRGFLQPLSTEPVMFSVISTAQEEEELNPTGNACFLPSLFHEHTWSEILSSPMQEDVPWSARETWEWDVELSRKRHKCQAAVLLGPAPFTVYSAAGMKRNLILTHRRVSFPVNSGDTNPEQIKSELNAESAAMPALVPWLWFPQ